MRTSGHESQAREHRKQWTLQNLPLYSDEWGTQCSGVHGLRGRFLRRVTVWLAFINEPFPLSQREESAQSRR